MHLIWFSIERLNLSFNQILKGFCEVEMDQIRNRRDVFCLKIIFLFFVLAIPAIVLFFVFNTNLNPVGYEVHLNKEMNLMTIEEGYVNKEIYSIEVTTNQALKVLLPIYEAKQLWEMNLTIFFFLVGLFVASFEKYIKPRKNFKWYVTAFYLFIVVFVIWHMNAHLQLNDKITDVLNSF